MHLPGRQLFTNSRRCSSCRSEKTCVSLVNTPLPVSADSISSIVKSILTFIITQSERIVFSSRIEFSLCNPMGLEYIVQETAIFLYFSKSHLRKNIYARWRLRGLPNSCFHYKQLQINARKMHLYRQSIDFGRREGGCYIYSSNSTWFLKITVKFYVPLYNCNRYINSSFQVFYISLNFLINVFAFDILHPRCT